MEAREGRAIVELITEREANREKLKWCACNVVNFHRSTLSSRRR